MAKDPNAHGKPSREEGQDAKEQGNKLEGENEPRSHEIVIVAANSQIRHRLGPFFEEHYDLLLNKSRWHIDIGAEVPVACRVKGKVGGVGSTVVLAISNRAEIPKSPTRGRRSAWNGTGVGFQEVDSVQRVLVVCTSQKCQPHQQEGRGHEENAPEAQYCS